MFGLTFEKLFLVAIVAGVVIGPQRLPGYAQRLGELVRAVRDFVEMSRARAEGELGTAITREEWDTLDPRRYHPRRLVRDALSETPAPVVETTPTTAGPSAALLAEAARVRPGQRYLVTGPASHPVRVLLSSLPPDDPRRLASEEVVGTEPAGGPGEGSADGSGLGRGDREVAVP